MTFHFPHHLKPRPERRRSEADLNAAQPQETSPGVCPPHRKP
ncbi:hypothetical protein TNCV_3214751, partial [Trichonephila clavipes]